MKEGRQARRCVDGAPRRPVVVLKDTDTVRLVRASPPTMKRRGVPAPPQKRTAELKASACA
jgi:hypothetical protein